MNSRKRIIETLNHRQPDRVAIDFGGTNITGVSSIVYNKIKKEFGKKLVFRDGGIDTQHTLNVGTIEEVKKMAKEMLDIFSPGGGYVFSQVHNIESCVPAENVLAAFETAKNYKVCNCYW